MHLDIKYVCYNKINEYNEIKTAYNLERKNHNSTISFYLVVV
jgi:hypothetical protein